MAIVPFLQVSVLSDEVVSSGDPANRDLVKIIIF